MGSAIRSGKAIAVEQRPNSTHHRRLAIFGNYRLDVRDAPFHASSEQHGIPELGLLHASAQPACLWSLTSPDRNLWFDPKAFAIPGQYQFGNSGRNILRGPSFGAADWALAKSFQFTEHARLQLRWDVFNVFNQTNMANPVTGIDSSLAGRITRLAHFMRRQQLGAHVYW